MMVNYNIIKQKMYKLWRREMAKPTTPDFNVRKKESSFSQNIATLIKFSKKKEEFYVKAISNANQLRPRSSTGGMQRQNISLKITELQQQLENLINEEEQHVTSLKSFEEEPFYLSKTFLYTVFVRLLQLYEYTKQRLILKQRNGEQRLSNNSWQKLYDEGKIALTDCYQNLIYFQNYNVHQIFSLAIRKQNHRIFSILPPKTRKVQVTLKPITRLSSTDLKKSHSIQPRPLNQQSIAELINKKLVKKEKKKVLQTQKRLQERKKNKKDPLTFKSLYGILGVKTIKVQQGYAFRKGMQIQALQRNATIIEQRKKWEKKFDNRSYSLKLIRNKYD